MFWTGVLIAAGTVAAVRALRKLVRVEPAWWSAAVELELGALPGTRKRWLGGVVHGHPVSVNLREADADDPAIHVSVWLPSAPGVIVRDRGVNSLLLPQRSSGDPELDERVVCAGPDAELRALLSHDVRVRLIVQHAELGERELTTRAKGNTAAALKAAVLDAVGLAQTLHARLQDPRAGLSENAARDPLPQVRQHCLRALRDHHADHPDTLEALRAALHDPAPSVRLYAAEEQPDAARPVLESLLADAHAPLEVRVRALQLLDRAGAGAAAALKVLRVSKAAPLLGAALTLARRQRLAEAVPVLRARLGEADPELAVDVAATLTALADPSAEPELIALLQRPDKACQRAAVDALSRLGSARAVEPLLAVAQRALIEGALEHAARAAVLAIQARIGPVEAGGVSLAESAPEQGALTLTTDAGALTLTDPKR